MADEIRGEEDHLHGDPAKEGVKKGRRVKRKKKQKTRR